MFSLWVKCCFMIVSKSINGMLWMSMFVLKGGVLSMVVVCRLAIFLFILFLKMLICVCNR